MRRVVPRSSPYLAILLALYFVWWEVDADSARDYSVPRGVLAAAGFRSVVIDYSSSFLTMLQGCASDETVAYFAHGQAAAYQNQRVIVCCGTLVACTIRYP